MMKLENVVARLAQEVERRYYGKYRSFVIDNADPEQLGRLKLTVPSVLGDAVVTGWAMPCVPYGGAMGQGFLFVPDVGAGVWVEFEEGDLEFPIWVGTFWSKPGGQSELPTPNGEVQNPPTSKIIKTAKGHMLQFEDADGDEKIVIKHKDNSFISIDKDGNVLIANKEGSHLHLNAKAGNTTLMDQNGNLITMGENGVLITNADGTAIEMKGGTVKVIADVLQISASDVLLDSSTVSLGSGAGESALHGDFFAQLWNAFIFHTHATGVGPSGPPIPPATLLAPGSGLSMGVKIA